MNIRHIRYRALLLLTTLVFLAGCSIGGDDASTGPAAEKAAESTGNPPQPTPPPPPPPPASGPDGDEPEPPRNEEETPVEPSAPPPSAPIVSQPPPVASSTPKASQPPKAQTPPVCPRQTGRPSIRLATGVALPQTGPTGTMMGFSVDYELTQGQPNRSLPYVWVIEPAKGQPVKFEVRLTDKGTLQVFVQKWRPENGPFQTHIEDPRGNRLSRSIPLR